MSFMPLQTFTRADFKVISSELVGVEQSLLKRERKPTKKADDSLCTLLFIFYFFRNGTPVVMVSFPGLSALERPDMLRTTVPRK
jgi:hypothetical protein